MPDKIVNGHHGAKMREDDFEDRVNWGQLAPCRHGKWLHNHMGLETMSVCLRKNETVEKVS